MSYKDCAFSLALTTLDWIEYDHLKINKQYQVSEDVWNIYKQSTLYFFCLRAQARPRRVWSSSLALA